MPWNCRGRPVSSIAGRIFARRELGEIEAAQETWRRGAASADGSLRGVIYERIAQVDEEAVEVKQRGS